MAGGEGMSGFAATVATIALSAVFATACAEFGDDDAAPPHGTSKAAPAGEQDDVGGRPAPLDYPYTPSPRLSAFKHSMVRSLELELKVAFTTELYFVDWNGVVKRHKFENLPLEGATVTLSDPETPTIIYFRGTSDPWGFVTATVSIPVSLENALLTVSHPRCSNYKALVSLADLPKRIVLQGK